MRDWSERGAILIVLDLIIAVLMLTFTLLIVTLANKRVPTGIYDKEEVLDLRAMEAIKACVLHSSFADLMEKEDYDEVYKIIKDSLSEGINCQLKVMIGNHTIAFGSEPSRPLGEGVFVLWVPNGTCNFVILIVKVWKSTP